MVFHLPIPSTKQNLLLLKQIRHHMFPSAFLPAVQYPQSFACQLFPTAAFSIKSNLMMQLAKDKGGMIFSPRVGLHENVAVLDYENEYANLILKHNLSYERCGTSKGLLPT